MPEILNIASYAKINLHLDVGNKRNDGFHNISSIFKSISLHDTIDIHIHIENNGDIDEPVKDLIEISGNFTCNKERNLIFRAASAFMQASGYRFYVKFNVKKIIPEGAGLGGGSSNAAAVLKNLYSLFPDIVGYNKITEAASSLGSDVLFFLGENTALVTGRGDIVNSIDAQIPEYKILLVFPGFQINTAEAYSWIDNDRKENDYEIKNIDYLSVLARKPSEWEFFNSFKNPLEKRFDIYEQIFSVFQSHGSDYFNITGSGSAVFGIFSDNKNLKPAYNELTGLCPDVWITDMLAG
ncbi:MAG: 4-(cytidine 5'-diphospho)-2-C-methyl-D-erythritol kinase [Spirochaetia bacterium]|jgi:4-diphosphocytidyl-2-C-methyl-D-erythritol kinase|nr:4-(cytidine 5'-diphospho)-2-C-methyl-D-erythritol kinase [Spirochaetia bacterium]